MKIKSLEIYGYGQFVQRTIKFDSFFTEIYGENEAGKSTIQAFIHSILFGFPTRKENEPRLEPRLGNQYGGKLILIRDDGSEIEVERIKGSAAGDLKVYLPNGAIKDEQWLREELNYISKRTYQGIFSFSVLGLQNIHKNMDETQLQNFLLQAGALGSTEFTSMRAILADKKEELYKKSGRKPVINQQIVQLDELASQIRTEEAKLDTYHKYVEERDKSAQRLDHLKNNLSQLSHLHDEKQKELALHAQTQEWKTLEKELNVEPVDFPEQGIDRYEASRLQTQNLKRDIGLREEKLAQLEQNNEQLSQPKESDINALKSLQQQENDIKQKEYEAKSMDKEINDKEREIRGLKLNIGWDKVHSEVDSSEAMKSHISEQLKYKQELIATETQLKRDIQENEIEKEANAEELDGLNQEIVPEETFEKKKQHQQQRFELEEKNNLYQKMKEAFDVEQQQKEKHQATLRLGVIILAIVSAALAVFSFISTNLLFGTVFALLTLVFIVGLFFIRTKEIGHSETFTHEINELQEQIKSLEERYNLDFDLDDQYRIRDQWHNAIKHKESLNKKAEYLHQTLKETTAELSTVKNQISQIKQELKVSDRMSDDLVIDGITTMNKIKDLGHHIEELKETRDHLDKYLEDFYTHGKEVTKHQIPNFNQLSFFHDVRQWLQEAQASLDYRRRNNDQITLLSNELKQLKQRLEDNIKVIDTLFDFTDVDNEEDYYKHYELSKRYENNLNRFNDLTQYLENQNYSYEDSSALSSKSEAHLTEENKRLSKQIDDYNEQYLEIQKEVSDLNSQITQMETDQTLADLRHKYHILKNQMNEEAKDWASLSYLQALVDGHIAQIKDKRLPQVVNEATHIFNRLTEGHYVQVSYVSDELMVKQRNGQIYHPVELSQSTKEILYISLRLSLIKTLKPYYPFPIIIDDAFVHFDKNRKELMMKYIRQLPEDYQVLYFTCAKDNNIPSKQLVTLNKVEDGAK
ncbi:AAA family ATPase [Staphylococcus sp. SQ8-PEA]|uniref:AAA family ATPase n=1 Tax=Staphylococcus marylandisciuri TaxID=2981529 RepID=A0ABT2QS88_9STAP|nr:AAA family ATPase [Staphylococcus marylandisciuri]MCU5746802.1 AAA family ATPase [Staphylococcus marylandisciuri]